jgi:hypothetical protein
MQMAYATDCTVIKHPLPETSSSRNQQPYQFGTQQKTEQNLGFCAQEPKKNGEPVPVNNDGTIQTIEVPDCSPSAFSIMIDYIYSNFNVNSIKITDDNVMFILYSGEHNIPDPLLIKL